MDQHGFPFRVDTRQISEFIKQNFCLCLHCAVPVSLQKDDGQRKTWLAIPRYCEVISELCRFWDSSKLLNGVRIADLK